MQDATRSQCQTPCKNIARTMPACFYWLLLHLPVVAITIRKSPLLRRCWEELLDSSSLPQRVQREVFVPWKSIMLKIRRSILPIFAFWDRPRLPDIDAYQKFSHLYEFLGASWGNRLVGVVGSSVLEENESADTDTNELLSDKRQCPSRFLILERL